MTNTSFIVFGMTRSWLEPIYRTWGERANHYTSDYNIGQLFKFVHKNNCKKHRPVTSVCFSGL
jgi:hypothetical protein